MPNSQCPPPTTGSVRLRHATNADVAAIPTDPPIESLDLQPSPDLTDLSPLRHHASLRALNLRGAKSLVDVSPLASLQRLQRLDISQSCVTQLPPLPALTHFSFFSPRGGEWNREILAQSPNLVHLAIPGDMNVRTPEFLTNLPKLRFLDFGYCPLESLAPVASLRHLETLELGYSDAADLSPLSHCRELRVLGCAGLTGLRDLAPVQAMPRLEVLVLDNCSQLADLSPIAHHPSLETLIILNCPLVTDLTPLIGLPKLAGVSTSGSGVKSLPAGFDESLIID